MLGGRFASLIPALAAGGAVVIMAAGPALAASADHDYAC
jgi:hypothetical protein